MQVDNNPIGYAQKIADLLADVPYAVADSALRIAVNLLEYRLKNEMSAVLANSSGAAEVET